MMIESILFIKQGTKAIFSCLDKKFMMELPYPENPGHVRQFRRIQL
jgi:hypothetical protein